MFDDAFSWSSTRDVSTIINTLCRSMICHNRCAKDETLSSISCARRRKINICLYFQYEIIKLCCTGTRPSPQGAHKQVSLILFGEVDRRCVTHTNFSIKISVFMSHERTHDNIIIGRRRTAVSYQVYCKQKKLRAQQTLQGQKSSQFRDVKLYRYGMEDRWRGKNTNIIYIAIYTLLRGTVVNRTKYCW